MPTTTQHLCYNCFSQRESPEGPCPYCGFDLAENTKKFPVALRAGTVLNNRYIVGRVLGQGGFGITYLAFDTQLQTKVAVKEYMPNDIATRIEGATVSVAMDTKKDDFTYGAERFQEEARTLAKFIGHPNIAGVSSYFDANDTSYFVMDYIEGISFKSYIGNAGGRVSVDEALNIMIPVLRALTAVHQEGFIHRDVTPDNIYISKDGNVKLLDFGSARYSIGDKSKSLDVILKVGYAPKEQYIRRGRQGPYTDVYSCAACLYAALTGVLPPESLERLDQDELVPVSQAGIEIPEWLDRAILKGLAVQPEDRFQSAAEFLDAIENQIAVEVPGAAPVQAPQAAKKSRTPLIAAVAALLAVAVGLGAFFGLRDGGGRVDPVSGLPGEVQRGNQPRLKKAEVPSITIQGTEYSTDLMQLELNGLGLTDGDILDLKYMINLRYLNLDDNNLTDLSPVSGLTDLEQLSVYKNPDLTDLSPLAGLTGLRNVGFDSSLVTDYSFMAGMTKLEYVRLFGVQEGTDLSALSGLTNVKSIAIDSNNFTPDLSFLSGMTGLQSLGLQVSPSLEELDLSFAANMTELTHLEIYNYGQDTVSVTDLTPLAGLTKLQELSIPAEVKSLAPLAGLTELRSLNLQTRNGNGSYYPLTDISALSGMTKLTTLSLALGDVKDLSPVSGLTSLTDLNLYGNFDCPDLQFLSGLAKLTNLSIGLGDVKDLSPVSGLTSLTDLQIYGNFSCSDLQFLSGLTKLRTLRINPNNGEGATPLTSLKGLENLTELRELHVNGPGNLTDVEPLANLTKLTTLSLPYRDYSVNEPPALDLSGLSGLTKLQALGVNSSVVSLEPLRGLTDLRSLQINADWQNPVESLEPLSGLEKLSSLYVYPLRKGADQSPVAHVKDLNIQETD